MRWGETLIHLRQRLVTYPAYWNTMAEDFDDTKIDHHHLLTVADFHVIVNNGFKIDPFVVTIPAPATYTQVV